MLFVVDLDLSTRCINHRNFYPLIIALDAGSVRMNLLDLSFNQFFRNESLDLLLTYMESKSISIMDAKCKDSV
jgi:hypothetical protein